MSNGHEKVHLGQLLSGFDGKWVATKNGEVVMAADTPYVLVSQLRERGIRDAAIIRAPAADEPEMIGFG